MNYIINFTVSRDFEEIDYCFNNGQQTNIDILLGDFTIGETNWTVPKTAKPGDIVLFLCGKNSKANLGSAVAHAQAGYSKEFYDFVNKEKALYQQYSGYLMGVGTINSVPEYDADYPGWFSDIAQLTQLNTPIHMDEFKSFIKLNSFGSITYLKDEQFERLKWVVNQKNPGFFLNVTPPEVADIEDEFNNDVKKESKKDINKLAKEAKKKASQPTVTTAITKTYYRDPTIAAYVKKRANGQCQLCAQKAPFNDKDGEPYLECHHITWLSKGGMDSIDNCVALCPNCHRKMHVVNDPEDIKLLMSKL